jgi:hypothetical protein
MKNALEISECCGAHLMISNAGRTVSAVVWVAPDTMPST